MCHHYDVRDRIEWEASDREVAEDDSGADDLDSDDLDAEDALRVGS